MKNALLGALALFCIGETTVAQTITVTPSVGTLVGKPATGIYSTKPVGLNLTTAGFISAIVSKDFQGNSLDFDSDGKPEVFVQVIGSQNTITEQTRVWVLGAQASNEYQVVTDFLVPNGQNRGYNANGSEYNNRGLAIGDVTGDGIADVVVVSGGLPDASSGSTNPDTWINILTVNTSTLDLTVLHATRVFGIPPQLINSNRTNSNDIVIARFALILLKIRLHSIKFPPNSVARRSPGSGARLRSRAHSFPQ